MYYGCQYFNDTVGTESNHKVDKQVFQQSSRRKSSCFKEMHTRNIQRLRNKTFGHLNDEHDARERRVDDVSHTAWSPIVTNREMWITFHDDGWYLRDDSSSSFIHPDVRMSAVTTLLADTVALISESKSDLIARMTCPELSDLEMYFVEGVSCHPATESGLPPFKVYATRHFNGTSTPRFDCIEILLTETDANGKDIISNAFAQVLGIFVVNCLGEDKMHIFFVVTVLESKENTRGDKYLPYDLLGYQKNMQLEIVEPENFYRPGILIPCHDRSEGLYDKRKETKKSRIDIGNFRFWGISYKTIDRFGYDEEQCDQIPVIDDMEVASIQNAFSRCLNHDELDLSTMDAEPGFDYKIDGDVEDEGDDEEEA